jgi:hypothetical protein
LYLIESPFEGSNPSLTAMGKYKYNKEEFSLDLIRDAIKEFFKDKSPIGVEQIGPSWFRIHDGQGGFVDTGPEGVELYNEAMKKEGEKYLGL